LTTAAQLPEAGILQQARTLPDTSMKIGFDAKRAFANFTGLGNYSRFMVRVLSEYYPRNEYWLYSPSAARHPDIEELVSRPNIKVEKPSATLKALKLGSYWRSVSLGKVANKNGVQLLHGLSNELPFGKSGNLKKIVTIHDLLFMRYPQLYNLVDIGIYKQKVRWACNNADRIIAVSKQTAHDLIEFLKVPQEKIDVVYQGCHKSFRQEYDSFVLDRISTKYKLPQDFILNVGTIEERKNALLILKAMAALKNKASIPLVIVGKPTAYKEVIVKYAREHNLLNELHFRHDVSFEDLPKVYQLSKMFVYPSVFEGFGIPILEALCSRVPVISSKGSCFSEAGGENSIYINPTSAEELAEAILRILNNPTMGTKMIIDGVGHSMKFEDREIARSLMAVYEKTLKQ
jgi:glycosyltransferase involved in cell wall biosynthesis